MMTPREQYNWAKNLPEKERAEYEAHQAFLRAQDFDIRTFGKLNLTEQEKEAISRQNAYECMEEIRQNDMAAGKRLVNSGAVEKYIRHQVTSQGWKTTINQLRKEKEYWQCLGIENEINEILKRIKVGEKSRYPETKSKPIEPMHNTGIYLFKSGWVDEYIEGQIKLHGWKGAVNHFRDTRELWEAWGLTKEINEKMKLLKPKK